MILKLFASIFLLLAYGFTCAQSCFPNGLSLTSQQQINDFPVDYPTCTEIEGFLIIDEELNANINDLSPLAQITSVGAYLKISANDALEHLHGLDNLSSVGEVVQIDFNENLLDLQGLGNLDQLNDLIIRSNNSLSNLNGISNLDHVLGNITIQGNNNLPDLSGLENLDSIGQVLTISQNDALESLEGLSSLVFIGGSLAIQFNNALSSVDGLEMLSTIGNYFTFQFNSGIENMNGFPQLDSVANYFTIQHNDMLENINGFSTLEHVGGFLSIQHNNELETIYGFNKLDSIGDFQAIQFCSKLHTINAFNNLETIENNLSLINNPLLSNILGFQKLSKIKGGLTITYCGSLKKLTWLHSLEQVDGNLTIHTNDALQSLSGLDNIDPNSFNQVLINSCENLTDCDVESICNYFDVPDNIIIIANNATGCNTSAEVQEQCALHPSCTSLISPEDGQDNVLIDSPLMWDPSPGSSSYLLSIGTSPEEFDLLNTLDVGNVTVYDPSDFPCITEIFVLLTPYNDVGLAFDCLEESFITEVDFAEAGPDQTICQGTATQLNGQGGTIYHWEPADGLNNPNIANPIAAPVQTTVYTLTVSNGNECEASDEITINVLPSPTTNAISTDESGFGFNDGSCFVNPEGGLLPYTFEWSNGEQTQGIFNLIPGTYSVTVTDANQCSGFETVVVNAFSCPEIILDPELVDASCANTCDGTISIVGIENGVPPFTYNWSDGSSTTTIQNLCEGNYTVTVTDSKHCSTSQSFVIVEPETLILEIQSTNETGFDYNDGSVFASPAGGTLPYSYLWSTGDTTPLIDGLEPGLYSVTISDFNSCETERAAQVLSYICPSMNTDLSGVDASCFGTCDGEIICEPQGGNSPYIYLWSNGNNEDRINDLCAGTYSITLTDSKNCSVEDNFEIKEPAEIIISVDEIIHVRVGQAGSIDISANGDYNYFWLGPNGFEADSADIDELEIGCYMLIVTNPENECSIDTTICIEDYTGINEIAWKKTGIRLYPNPARNYFNIDFNLSQEPVSFIEIRNADGKKIKEIFRDQSERQLIFDTSDWIPGIYYLRVKSKKEYSSKLFEVLR